ncbi:AzlC family ABC transporter permease, partial [Mesorhizobium sp. M2A.F.Ca.ET.067.02.1.1]|uniref:AzlC family ABC transporter permease n=1 Tax=Mesorhizobium sp. M2A.F.Ca.ET.067.02.1.1 TaxID=2496749 RepID=UPI000FD20977
MSVSEIAVAEGKAANRRGAEFRRGLAAATPVLLGVIPYALVLGAQAAQRGLSVLEVPLMTGLNFAGGSEFAAIQLWTSPPHVLLIAAITLLVNSRHFLMCAALAPFIRHLPQRQVFPAL